LPTGFAADSQKGGRVLVVASDVRAKNLDLLSEYAEARSVPASNRCVLSGLQDAVADVASREITADDYQRFVLTPVQSCLAGADDPDGVDFIVVVRGMPHHVRGDGWQASLEALLTVGATEIDAEPLWRRSGSAPNRPTFLNPLYKAFEVYDLVTELKGGRVPAPPTYRDDLPEQVLVSTSEGIRREGPMLWDLRPAYRLDAGSDSGTSALIARSIESDGTAPAGEWLCMEGADPARGVRDRECGRALDLLEELEMVVARAEWDPALQREAPVIAYLTGAANLQGAIEGLTYLPGALTDNITSHGAVPMNWSYEEHGESQTSIVRFLEAGASATHGTSAEPLNGAFASAGLMVLYARGYTLGEAYALSLPYLRWMNVPVGDPLMAPYAAPDPDPEPAPEPEPDPEPEPGPAAEGGADLDHPAEGGLSSGEGGAGTGGGGDGGCRFARGLPLGPLRR
jgi:hypothetical protein